VSWAPAHPVPGGSGAACRWRKGRILLEPAAEPVVQVFSETGRERIFHRELVVPASAGLALGPEEQDGNRLLAHEPLGEADRWVTKNTLTCAFSRARTIWSPISAPSRSLVPAKDSLNSTKQHGRIWLTIALIRLSSSSSRPLVMLESSSRMKWLPVGLHVVPGRVRR
jgi:hypothetical protein